MAWYPDTNNKFPMTTDQQKANNSEHFPDTLFGGAEMVFHFEVSVVNSDPDGGLLKRDLLALAENGETLDFRPCETEPSFKGRVFSFWPDSMEYAEKIIQFFRESTYWQVEYVHITWEWEYE